MMAEFRDHLARVALSRQLSPVQPPDLIAPSSECILLLGSEESHIPRPAYFPQFVCESSAIDRIESRDFFRGLHQSRAFPAGNFEQIGRARIFLPDNSDYSPTGGHCAQSRQL